LRWRPRASRARPRAIRINLLTFFDRWVHG
jgi:hypothetical protein